MSSVGELVSDCGRAVREVQELFSRVWVWKFSRCATLVIEVERGE